MEFVTTPWLIAINEDESPSMCIRKSSQVRISTYAIFRTLWEAIRHNITVIFTQPTRDDAQKFSGSRVTPIIDQNRLFHAFATGGTEMRRFSNVPYGPVRSHIHYRGTFGEKEAFTIDADTLVIDEIDLSNPEVVSTFDTRLVASKRPRKLYISTPSIPQYGIDAKWAVSDQTRWFITCDGCNREVDPQEEFYRVIDVEDALIRCPHCGKRLRRMNGQWVQTRKGKGLLRGYSVSQLQCLYISVESIIEAMHTKKPRRFANFWLGLPSEEGVGRVTREIIEQKCFLSGHPRSTVAIGGRRFMGVDQGDYVYAEIAEVGADGRTHIVHLPVFREWDRLYTLMRQHEIEVCVIDMRPEVRLARQFAHDFPGRVWMMDYTNIQDPVRWEGREKYQIQASRWQVLDAVAENIVAGAVQLYAPVDDDIDSQSVGGGPSGWIQHWESQHRVEPEEEGDPIQWKETGPDHRTHASVYRMVAESRIRKRDITEVWVATGGQRVFAAPSSQRTIKMPQDEIGMPPEPRRPINRAPRVSLTRRHR